MCMCRCMCSLTRMCYKQTHQTRVCVKKRVRVRVFVYVLLYLISVTDEVKRYAQLQQHGVDRYQVTHGHGAQSDPMQRDEEGGRESHTKHRRLAEIQQRDGVGGGDGEVLQLFQVSIVSFGLLLLVGEEFDDLVVQHRVDEEPVATVVHIHQVLADRYTPLKYIST